MDSHRYSKDVLSAAGRARPPAAVDMPAELGLVLEDNDTGFVGDIVELERDVIHLRDRFGKIKAFPITSRFLVDGEPVRLVRAAAAQAGPRITASGSIAATDRRAKVARRSRIFVEGRHDADLVLRVFGEDAAYVGVAVEFLDGIDDLPAVVREFGPSREARLGILVDHLVPGSKESRIVSQIKSPHVLVTGHPYVDVWQAVKPACLGRQEWPVIAKGQDWKAGICAEFGIDEPWRMWQHILSRVNSYVDLEPVFVGCVERLLDFVSEPQ